MHIWSVPAHGDGMILPQEQGFLGRIYRGRVVDHGHARVEGLRRLRSNQVLADFRSGAVTADDQVAGLCGPVLERRCHRRASRLDRDQLLLELFRSPGLVSGCHLSFAVRAS